jgi:hypothetical protein
VKPAGIIHIMRIAAEPLDRLLVASLERFLQALIQFGIPTSRTWKDSDSRDKRRRESLRLPGDL